MPHLSWETALAGLLVGMLVGMTGMGGGSLMAPVLVFLLGVKPIYAVGTDLAYSAVTKWVGGFKHYRQGTVDMGIVRLLALGSVPGSLLGVGAIQHLHRLLGADSDALVLRALGLVLIMVATTMVVRAIVGSAEDQPDKRLRFGRVRLSRAGRAATVVLGLVVGFLVGLTSVGSGTLFVAVLVAFYPLALHRIVGTDVLHAALLTTVAGLAHLSAGNVEGGLMLNLLLGSIPGVWIGATLSTRASLKVLRPILAVVLLISGSKMLDAQSGTTTLVALGLFAAAGGGAAYVRFTRRGASGTPGFLERQFYEPWDYAQLEVGRPDLALVPDERGNDPVSSRLY
jgi:uncharacterized membrane protein YfcA